MNELLSSVTLAAIIFMCLILWYYNQKQANALKKMAKSMLNMNIIEIRNRRDAKKKEIGGIDPLPWIQKYSGADFKLIDIKGVSSLPTWAEFRGEKGRVVVSPLEPDELKAATKPNKKLRFSDAETPLLGTRKDRVVTSVRSMVDDEVFDLEAQQVCQSLGLDWGDVTQLTFVVIE